MKLRIIFLLFFVQGAYAAFNRQVLDVIKTMPTGGGYETNSLAFENLQKAITIQNKQFKIQPEIAKPSFCSSATYLVFMKVLANLEQLGQLKLSYQSQENLLVGSAKDQPDGFGIWGRWNSNGPGTAKVFKDLKIGKNFTKLDEALPGDFLKIFWNDEIGAKEKGHSVVFTGVEGEGHDKKICYWSSNQLADNYKNPGMGGKCSPLSKVHRMLFSRFESVEGLDQKLKSYSPQSAQYKDAYLGGLLKLSTTPQEMCEKVDCQPL